MSKNQNNTPRSHHYRIGSGHSIEDIFDRVAASARRKPRGLGFKINGDLIGTVDQENVKQAFAIESDDGLSQLLGHIALVMTAKTPWPLPDTENLPKEERKEFYQRMASLN